MADDTKPRDAIGTQDSVTPPVDPVKDPDVSPTAYRSSPWRRFLIVMPFGIHMLIVAAATVFMFMISGLHFYPGTTRAIYAKRPDGSLYRRPGYTVLQSDITILIATFASLARTAGVWEAGAIMLRCCFLSMEQGGISLKGVKRILTGWPLHPRHLTVKRYFFVFLLLLMANYSLDFASMILSGSITWIPTLDFVLSDTPLLNVPHNRPGLSLQDYRQNQDFVHTFVATSAAMGDVTWGTLGTNSSSMTRVLQSANFLSIGSTIQNVTVPFFVVDNFEWIKDPNSTLTSQQTTLLFNYNAPYNPYVTANGWLGLIPDVGWGPLTNTNMTDPLSVSETRTLSLRLSGTQPGGGCDGVDGTIPSDVGRYRHPINTTEECFAFARVTYRAGVALCDDCVVTLPAVIQKSPASLTMGPDPLAAEALAIAPYVGMNLMATEWAVPPSPPFQGTQGIAVEFLSRSYQAAWNSLTEGLGDPALTTNLQLSVLTTEAFVTKWKVLLWVLLHLFSMAAKLFFYANHRSTPYPWLDNPPFNSLFLDTEELRNVCDSWNPDEKLPDVMLELVNADSRRRRIVVNPLQNSEKDS